MDRDCAIETTNLTKRYGQVEVVRGLNLNIRRDQITGFLGRNGAGKSTTIKMLLGMTSLSGGTGIVLGRRIGHKSESLEIRRRIAYVGEDKELYGYMTVEQLIHFTASFYPDWRPEQARRLQDQYDLPSKKKVQDLSKGMRAKTALLLALSRRPELLILDEPSDGLDPVSIEELLQALVAAASDGTTVFFSSHQIAEIERIADRVCIVDHGKLVTDLVLDKMRKDHRRITLGFSWQPNRDDFDIRGIERIRTSGRQIVVWASHNADAIVERARSLDAVSVDIAPISLRDVFLETVKEAE